MNAEWDNYKQAVIDANPIMDVALEHGLQLDAKGRGRCPFPDRHNNGDANPSLSINMQSQRIFCNSQQCFGDRGANVIDFVMVMKGIEFKPALYWLAERAGMKDNREVPKKTVTGTWIYEDEEGKPLYRSVRLENSQGKIFRMQRPNGNGWANGIRGIARVLYRLPDILKSTGVVLLVEGEKCVDALRALGIVATCNPNGAGNWQNEINPPLNRRDVVFWPDKDGPGFMHLHKVAASLKEVASSIRVIDPPEDLPKTGDVIDAIEQLGWGKEEIQAQIDQAMPYDVEKYKPDQKQSSEPEEKERHSQSEKIVTLVTENCELFCNSVREAYALVDVNGHYEILSCKGGLFRRWLARMLYENEGKAPGSEAIRTALNVIEAKAEFEGKTYDLHNRVAVHDGAIWYDLTDKNWRAISVDSGGWKIEDNPPILFSRYSHQQPQVEPVKDGNVQQIFDFIPMSDPDDRLLLMCFLVAALIPGIPHPVLVLHGPQGSGKSTCFRILRELIDPSQLGAMSFPRNSELIQTFSHNWCLFFDNVSGLQQRQSDALCRAVTGEGMSKRMLFTNEDDLIYQFKRVVGLNGINVAATQPDLLDRGILVGLERISGEDRRTEDQVWADFEQAKPDILGGMFDALSKALTLKGKVSLNKMPRMADFALWGCAIAQALGFSSEDFQKAYWSNIGMQNDEVLESHPIAAAIIALMNNHNEWCKTPAETLGALVDVAEAEKIDTKDKSWPKAASVLTRKINEVKPNLIDFGIQVEIHRDHSGRFIAFKAAQNADTSDTPTRDDKKQQLTHDSNRDGICDAQNADMHTDMRNSLKNKARVRHVSNVGILQDVDEMPIVLQDPDNPKLSIAYRKHNRDVVGRGDSDYAALADLKYKTESG